MKIYIAGKITGLPPAVVRQSFEMAKLQLQNWGYNPISPLDNECTSMCWCDQMRACLDMLLDCKGIYLLSNWEDSDGAKIEMTFARKRGMYIIEQTMQNE